MSDTSSGARRGDWPDHPLIYQIYPRSFQDTTGSGEGDLAGITRRLDHIARLGADAIWLSPFYTSPMDDGGYDVADHCAVDPRFGTLADFDELVARAHDLGLKVMIDQVFNHTSDQHPWFQRSLAGDPDYADFYVWADPCDDGRPPSNWIGYFGLPSWRWHPQRRQYCLHQFLPSQPGLNHYNPAVNAALGEISRFWRDRGVDGFRYDAVTSIFFDKEYRDNPPAGDDQGSQPGSAANPFTMQRHDYDMLPKECASYAEKLREWAGPDAYLMGEINDGPTSVETLEKFTAPSRLDAGYVVDLAERGLTGGVLADVIERMEGPGRLIWWLSCHDQPRQVSRAGDGSARDARMLAALLLALPGPVLIYQGEELGMPQPDLPKSALRDPFDLAFWPEPPGRDGARTPIPWQAGEGYGFTTGVPWLPMELPPGGPALQQWEEPGSVLSFYHGAIAERRALGLAGAAIECVVAEEDFFAARLSGDDSAFLLVTNLGQSPRDVPEGAAHAEVALSSDGTPPPGRIAPRSTLWLRL
ncbi:MAG: alpha-amylase family glycosyl hydrolase [Pseudomonadota bacterium]